MLGPVLVRLTTGSFSSSNSKLPELLGRVDVELAAGELVDLALQPHEPLVELARKLAEPARHRRGCR